MDQRQRGPQMESLGDILKRIMRESKERQMNGPKDNAWLEPSTADQPVCPNCDGFGFVSRRVPLGHPDFGEVFPCRACRSSEEGQARLQRYATLPRNLRCSRFEDFEPREGTGEARQAAQNFAAGPDASRGHWGLTLCGPVGLGKSTLLTCIGNQMLAQGYAVKYGFVPEMMDAFRASFGDDSEVTYDELLRAYTAADVLLLDDITELRATDFARDALTRLVDQRYRDGGLFVATTNLDVDTMAKVWGYRLADRLFDTGSDLVQVVHMGGISYRTGRKWGLPWPGRRRSD